MRKERATIITIITLIIIILDYMFFNKESMEKRIISGDFYISDTEKASETLQFSINPKDYRGYNGKALGKRQFLMGKYDTKVYLEPIKSQGDDLWVEWSFENNWWKKSGTCFTYRAIVNKNGQRLYSDANPNFEAVDQDGNGVNEDWGGGGSTYVYGFRIKKNIFENCKSINVRLSNFNIVNYQISLAHPRP